VRRGVPILIAAALAALVVVDGAQPLGTWSTGAAAAVLVVTLGWRAFARWQARGTGQSALLDVEIGLLSAVGTCAVVQRAEAPLAGALDPLVFVLVALFAAIGRPATAATVAFAVVVLQGAAHLVAPVERPLVGYGLHAAFVATFAVLYRLVLREELARVRAGARARLAEEMARMRDQARSYRLIAAPSIAPPDARPGGTDRLARSSVEEIHEAVVFALDLLRRSLGLHAAILLWLNESGSQARITELSIGSDVPIADGPFQAGDGVIGAVVARHATVTLENLKATYKLPFYEGPCPVQHLCAVPVEEHGQVRGVLVVDRRTGPAFDTAEEDLVASAARYLVRAVQNERVLVQVERAKAEQGKLYRAAEALGAAIGEADVLEAGVRSAREFAQFDFAAVTVYDAKTRVHEIRAVSGEEGGELVGARFQHNNGLVAMVVQNLHPLPWRGEYDPEQQVLFTKRLAPPKMPSILVLPLSVHDRPLGTLVLGARRRGAFGAEERPLLEILARHVAVSLANARMVKKLEEMATTDGMTGLLNKRAMLDMAAQKIAAAARFDRKLSVIITDIDHFKKVNDTWGHDVGDQVIRGLGELLRRAKRQTDSVARFGGEEFVLVCEETDDRGALLLAERVRTELEQTTFRTPNGAVQVTCSLGIASFPEAGRDWESLFKAADEALYVSKRSGRNRATVWHPQRKTAA
jgi:diguanylate cyclase (GGDEF)-like protein